MTHLTLPPHRSKQRPSLAIPAPKVWVKSALGSLGVQRVTNGYWFHALQSYLITSLPDFLKDKVWYGMIPLVQTVIINVI